MTEAAFRSALFEGSTYDVPVNSLILNADRQMSRISMYKRGLSDSLLKTRVQDDKVTCSPLEKDGKLVYLKY